MNLKPKNTLSLVSLSALAIVIVVSCVSHQQKAKSPTTTAATLPGFESYHLRSLALAEKKHSMTRQHATVVLAEPYAFRAQVAFTGEWRHISDRSLRMLNQHSRLQSDTESAAAFVAGFHSEIRVQEKDRFYWLPLSESLVGDFDRVIKPQQKVTLYCLLLGADSGQWTTVVTAFHSESQKSPRPSQRWTSF